MLLLAIDTSGKQGSIALSRAEENDAPSEIETIEIIPLVGGTFSAQLIPQISTLISSNGYTKDAVGGLAVVSGPGSFTGLRVGLAAAKALAEILDKPIVAVSLLEAIAFVSGANADVVAAIDAGRGNVYIGEYNSSENPNSRKPSSQQERMLRLDDFLEEARKSQIVTSDSNIAAACRQAGLAITAIQPVSAEAVARLGWRKIKMGETTTPDELEANYIQRIDPELLEKSRE
jgi:tRNA threonylcarbamoyladenosine biosynthesis protein TsaB